MNSFKKRCGVAAVLVGFGLCVGLVSQSGTANMFAARPSSIVSVNLGVLLDKLEQRSEADRRIEKMRSDLKEASDAKAADLEKMKAEAKKLQDQLEITIEAKERESLVGQLDDLQTRAAESKLSYEAWFRINSTKLDIEMATAFEDVFRTVVAATADLAKASGYDFVIIDDSKRDLRANPQANVARIDQIQSQLADRRTLYVNPELDVTDTLVVRMNNAFKAAAKPNPAPNP
jgi:Skp family chaperone for outer membrane proteins